MNIPGLDEFNKDTTPSDYEFLLFIMFERGLSLEQVNELPIPYIMSMSKVYAWTEKQKAKPYKTAKKGK